MKKDVLLRNRLRRLEAKIKLAQERGMPVQAVALGASYVMLQLSPDDVAYARDPARGEYRGFAALHDRMDANMILPFGDEFEQDKIDYLNCVMEVVSMRIFGGIGA